MRGFQIKKITISGDNKKDSTLEFSDGINILYGESNMGKSKTVECIDYCLGSKVENFETDIPFSVEATGYDVACLEIGNEIGSLKLKRSFRIGETGTVNVETSLEEFSEGDYKVGGSLKKENSLSALLLRFAGVPDGLKVLKDTNYSPTDLSFRDLAPIYIIEDERISTHLSVLRTDQQGEKTKRDSVLQLLTNGRDISKEHQKLDSQEFRKGRKTALKDYFASKIEKNNKRILEIKDEIFNCPINLTESTLEDSINELKVYQSQYSEVYNSLNSCLHTKSDLIEQLQSIELDLQGCENLMSQYRLDYDRAQFILKGGTAIENLAHSTLLTTSTCPVCNQEIDKFPDTNFKEAAETESKSIEGYIDNLRGFITALKETKMGIESDIQDIEKEIIRLKDHLRLELQPKIDNFWSVPLVKDKLFRKTHNSVQTFPPC